MVLIIIFTPLLYGKSFLPTNSQYVTTIKNRIQTDAYTIHTRKKPSSIDELVSIMQSTCLPISIEGKRYSQGGQTVFPHAYVINMSHFNKIIALDVKNKSVTVQSGITWRDLQAALDKENLSVQVMQSYNDFSVGGSLSVNVHARDVQYGPVINTVKSMIMLLADGSLVYTDRTHKSDLFKAAIGGYGLLGIILEVTLELTDNSAINKNILSMPLKNYTSFFLNNIYQNKNAVFHNALLHLNNFSEVTSITYYKTDQKVTQPLRMHPYRKFYPSRMILEQIVRFVPALHKIRPVIEPFFMGPKEEVIWRNYEMSYSVNQLRRLVYYPSTPILQEYFIPIEKLEPFIAQLHTIVEEYKINVINISIRYVPQDTTCVLAYAQQQSFAVVLYININNSPTGLTLAQTWTQKIIDAALNQKGSFYLPYHLFATKTQFNEAYPQWSLFLKIKNKYDPNKRFNNMFLKKYA